MPFVEMALHTDPSLFDECVALLSTAGFTGFWEDGSTLKCYIPGNSWSAAVESSLQSLLTPVAQAHGVPVPSIAHALMPDKDWNEAWEASLLPICATDRIIITPSWHRAEQERSHPGKIIITIDPKMSFGTGYHETTRLMLRVLQKHLKQGDVVLDVGTGTGILAIASIRMGAARAVGIDNDEWAAANAAENIRVNGVERHVTIIEGELAGFPEQRFNVIAANIQCNVILQLLPAMADRLVPGGLLLLSGLLIPDRPQIKDALAGLGAEIREETTEQEWLAVAATIVPRPQ